MDNFLAYPLQAQDLPRDSELRSLARLRMTMPEEDQEALDELLHSVREHWPLQPAAAHLISIDLLLLTMLIEQKKEMKQLRNTVERSGEDTSN
jgi:hypothetical protein